MVKGTFCPMPTMTGYKKEEGKKIDKKSNKRYGKTETSVCVNVLITPHLLNVTSLYEFVL